MKHTQMSTQATGINASAKCLACGGTKRSCPNWKEHVEMVRQWKIKKRKVKQ